METIFEIIEYGSLIGICGIVFSCFRMIHYLHEKGVAKSSLYSFDVFFLTKYIEMTRKENGRAGLWCKVLVIAVIVTAISGISSELISLSK